MLLPTLLRPPARYAALWFLAAREAVTGGFRLLAAQPRVQILLYHGLPSNHLQAFERQIRWLASQGTFVPYSRAVELIYSGHIDRPYFAISFDDGLASSLTAASLLADMGISACFFVCPGILDWRSPQETAHFCLHRIRIRPASMMRWSDLESLLRAGHEVGSHTMTHAHLAQTPPSRLSDEIDQSRQKIIRRVGRCEHFAWCFGQFTDFSPAAARAVFAAGYRSCASGVRGSHAPPPPAISPVHLAPHAPLPQTFTGPPSPLPCLRRDQLEPHWPLAHVRYFLARSARHPLTLPQTWPPDWPTSP